MSIPPAAPQAQKPYLQKDGFVFLCWHVCYWRNGIYWVFLGDLRLFWAGKSVGLGAGTSGCARRTDGGSILSAAPHPAQPCTLQQGCSARQNTHVGRQLVPKLLEESSSWPLVCSEVGWIDCAAGNPGPGDRGGRSHHRLLSAQKKEGDFYVLWRLFSYFGKSFYFMCLCKCFITQVLWVL